MNSYISTQETETALGNMEDEFTSLKTLYHNILGKPGHPWALDIPMCV